MRTGSVPAKALLVAALLATVVAPQVGAAVEPSGVSDNVRVNQRSPGDDQSDFKSPSVAIDPGDANRVVAASRRDQPDFDCRIDYSRDGGASWSASAFPTAPKGTCWSPGAAWDAEGNAYVAAQNRPPAGGAQDIVVWRSSDGGETFDAPVVIPRSAGFQAGIAVDTHAGSPFEGRIYVTWYSFPGFPASIDAFMAHSDDGGRTWSAPISRPIAGQYQEFTQPAVAPDGTVYVVFKDGYSNFFTADPPAPNPPGCLGLNASGDPSTEGVSCPIRLLRSSDGGEGFDGDPFMAATAYYDDLSVGEQPGIAVAPDGAVVVTYSSIGAPGSGCGDDLDAHVVRSTDRGQTWSAPVRVNDDGCAGGADQRNPWVSIAPNGRVDAVFYDNRADRTDPRSMYDVRYANSTDGGRTFGPNLRISDTAFDATSLFTPRPGGFQNNEFDQVNGIASTDQGAVAAWGDTRQASGSSSRSDVFSALVELAPPAPPAPPAPLSPPGLPGGFSVSPCGIPGSVGYLNPAKLRVSRARVARDDRQLDVLAPITTRARGADVAVTYQGDGRVDTFDARVTDADTELDEVRIAQDLTRGQAELGTGIVNLDYLGDADTRREFVRLRAASRRAELEVEEISLVGDRLSARGSVTGRAEGIVRLQFSYVDPDGSPQVHPARAQISEDGDWVVERDLVPGQLARCGGYLSIQFTGYFERRIRGEQVAYELDAGQTRRP